MLQHSHFAIKGGNLTCATGCKRVSPTDKVSFRCGCANDRFWLDLIDQSSSSYWKYIGFFDHAVDKAAVYGGNSTNWVQLSAYEVFIVR